MNGDKITNPVFSLRIGLRSSNDRPSTGRSFFQNNNGQNMIQLISEDKRNENEKNGIVHEEDNESTDRLLLETVETNDATISSALMIASYESNLMWC